MPRLSWSDGALRDLLRHRDFLASRSPDTGRRVVKALRVGMGAVGLHPEIGRPVEGYPDTFREWVIEFGSSAYVALYKIEDTTIFVVAVRHGREDSY